MHNVERIIEYNTIIQTKYVKDVFTYLTYFSSDFQ